MNVCLHTIEKSQPADSATLFCLLWLLRYENPYFETIDPDAPIRYLYSEAFDEHDLMFTVVLFELINGVDVPDDYLDPDSTLRQLATKIQSLPRMTDQEFVAMLKETNDVIKKALFMTGLDEMGAA